MFGRALKQDARHPKALAGMIRARLAAGDLKSARSMIKGIPADLAGNPEIASAISAVDLVEQSRQAAGDIGELRRRVQAAPDGSSGSLRSRDGAVREGAHRGGGR